MKKSNREFLESGSEVFKLVVNLYRIPGHARLMFDFQIYIPGADEFLMTEAVFSRLRMKEGVDFLLNIGKQVQEIKADPQERILNYYCPLSLAHDLINDESDDGVEYENIISMCSLREPFKK